MNLQSAVFRETLRAPRSFSYQITTTCTLETMMRALLYLVLLLVQLEFVAAFPTRAGSCPADKAAVDGRHVASDGGTRPVNTGALSNKNIQFYVDGLELNNTTAEITLGAERAVEIVASSPFKGALIRIESEAEFTLVPEINAQAATVCTAPAIGVSHKNKDSKYVLSAIFRADLAALFKVDVTVVEYNNATGSSYWYSQFTVLTVQANGGPKLSQPPTPVPTTNPVSSLRPTVTVFPTYEQKCNVCGEGKMIGNPEAEVFVENNVGSCKKLAEDGMRGFIPPEKCREIQLAATMSCECSVVPTPAVTTDEPTRTPFPTITSLPTFTTKCNVCGEGSQVADVSAIVTLNGVMGTCLDLERDGNSGYIGPDLCEAAQTTANELCKCTKVAPSYPAPAPTVSPYPTVTSFPTFAEKCNVCGEGMHVTNHDVVVTVDGVTGTCRELETEGAGRYIPPDVCVDAKLVAADKCGCTEQELAPSPSEITMRPTATAFPTVSFSPTYSEPCFICEPGNWVTMPDVTVVVDNLVVSCGELQGAGMERLIPPTFCPEAMAAAKLSCGCTGVPAPSPSEGASSPAPSQPLTYFPTVTAFPTITAVPTYAEKCIVCGYENRRVTNLKKIILVGGIKITCAAVEEYGATGYVPLGLCPQAKQRAQESCGCSRDTPIENNTSESPPPDSGMNSSESTSMDNGMDSTTDATSGAIIKYRVLTGMAVLLAASWLV